MAIGGGPGGGGGGGGGAQDARAIIAAARARGRRSEVTGSNPFIVEKGEYTRVWTGTDYVRVDKLSSGKLG